MRLKLYLIESCPLSNENFGGIPTVGGYGSNKEYEIGIGLTAEALHCILGSLGKLLGGNPLWVENEHIHEELGLIKKFIKEYSKDLYLDRQINQRLDSKYTQDMFRSIKKASPKLIKKAKEKMNKLDRNMDPAIYRIAKKCYEILIILAEEALKSIEEIPMKLDKNAFKSKKLSIEVRSLELSINKLFDKDRNTTFIVGKK